MKGTLNYTYFIHLKYLKTVNEWGVTTYIKQTNAIKNTDIQ